MGKRASSITAVRPLEITAYVDTVTIKADGEGVEGDTVFLMHKHGSLLSLPSLHQHTAVPLHRPLRFQ